MRKKAVFLDIDGTLVDRTGAMPESTKTALLRASENGHEIVLCTGRSMTQLDMVVKLAPFTGVVCSAGANVRRHGEVVWRGAMPEEQVAHMVSYFRDNKMTYFLQAESGIYAEQWCVDNMAKAFAALGRSAEEAAAVFGATIVREDTERVPYIEKCCYFQCDLPADEVQAGLGPAFDVVDSSFKVSRFCDGEVCRAGVNKASGMARYLEAAGIPHEDCIAFGDGPNDFEMLEYAAVGVCMGNGVDALKKVADRVCGDIHEDGLYNEFKALGLI